MCQSPSYEPWESLTPQAAQAQYNLLVQGFQAGQLNLRIEVPRGLSELPDPYDPVANAPYREAPYKFHDLTYYKGKLYLYFGVTPAVLFFWPFRALTGRYLAHREAVWLFCTIGFLVSAALLYGLWRRYFPEVRAAVIAAGVIALGLASGLPYLLSWAGIQQVPISCGYLLTMLTLAAIWRTMQNREEAWCWLAFASLVYGLAIASRPNLFFGAIILLAPVLQARRERRRCWVTILAAIGPILLVGIGLMLYNTRRFGNPFEFGVNQTLTDQNVASRRLFGFEYVWFHFRVYFWEPARWGKQFPFLHDITLPSLPAGHHGLSRPFGILTNIPFVWLALAAPLALWHMPETDSSNLRRFVYTLVVLFGICALTICSVRATAFRYEIEFLPILIILAVIGILGCERALDSRPVWRWGVRIGWGLMLGFSVTFNLLITLEHYAYGQNELGMDKLTNGKTTEAIQHFDRAIRLKPDYADAHRKMGVALAQLGKLDEAIDQYEQAVRLNPDFFDAHNDLGIDLARAGKVDAAIAHFERALQIKPGSFEAHNDFGVLLLQQNNREAATAHFEQAVRIKPDSAEAHNNLGLALMQAGKTQTAIAEFEQALRLDPASVEAQANLARARMAL